MNKGKLIYITGFSGSGKTTLSKELQKCIRNSVLLDGDEIRNNMNKDLGFTREDKIENIRRNNALIQLLYDQGFTVICAFMASISEERDKVFNTCTNNVKIQLTTPIEVCIKRDPKGLYKRNPDNFSGINFKYELFVDADIKLDTTHNTVEECLNIIKSGIM